MKTMRGERTENDDDGGDGADGGAADDEESRHSTAHNLFRTCCLGLVWKNVNYSPIKLNLKPFVQRKFFYKSVVKMHSTYSM